MQGDNYMKIQVGVSNHHVHLKEEHLNILFGCPLTFRNPLNQPGQFASNEVVTIKTEKAEIKNVRVLGPVRPYTQIEISKTDAYTLGLNPPIRESGDVKGSEVVTIIGPNGSVTTEGCILATRHIHVTPKEAEELGLKENHYYQIKVPGIKGGILNNVSVRISEASYYEIHLDTDDANACLLKQNDEVEILDE